MTDESDNNHNSHIDAVFKQLAQFSGEVNRMTTDELVEKLKFYGLDTGGTDNVKRRRLKDSYRRNKLASLNLGITDKFLPHYVVIDFEATCSDNSSHDFLSEIIEFPAVLVNSQTQTVEDTFRFYCKPVINPKLTDFCTDLTGITQEQVDAAENFEVVLKKFHSWLRKHGLEKKKKFAVVTDGPWDTVRFLFEQCHHSKVPFPWWAKEWVDLKRLFANFYKVPLSPLMTMLRHLGMEFEGRLHSGLDDAMNLSRVLIRMILDGARICPNERITKNPPPRRHGERQRKDGNQRSGTQKATEVDENEESSREGKNLRVKAYYAVIGKANKLPTCAEVKRRRKILEAKMNRKMEERLSRLELSAEMDGEDR